MASQSPLGSHRQAWLDAHPDRDGAWLRRMAVEGFDIHHIDGDHSNDGPDNLVLIEHADHMRVHGQAPFRRGRGVNWSGFVRNVVTKEEAAHAALRRKALRIAKEQGRRLLSDEEAAACRQEYEQAQRELVASL